MKGGETYPKDNHLLDPLHKPVVTSPATMASSSTTEETGEKAEKRQKFDDETMLRKRIKALENEIDDLKKRIHDLESPNQKHDKIEKELEKIKTERDRLQTEIELLSTKNDVLTKKLETLTKELEKVTKELEKVTKTCERLEKMESRLALGQVAWLLEKEISKAVLPDKKMGTVRIFDSMEEWLEENKLSAEGIAAQKRWDDLKIKLKWKEISWNKKHHRKALYLLKNVRKVDAHPKVDLEVARQQLTEGGHVAEWQIESCMDIIDMLETLKQT